MLYRVFLGQSQGPRIGTFIELLGIDTAVGAHREARSRCRERGGLTGEDRAMTTQVVINLQPDFFGPKERVLIEHEGLSVSLFRFDSGVEAVRVRNSRGEMTVLPFHGQQVWDARFDGRILTMKSMFTQPLPTRDYMSNYSAFVIHCGATAMGNPGTDDTHPLHGELPNAPYGSAFVAVGSTRKGRTSRWAAPAGTPSPSA